MAKGLERLLEKRMYRAWACFLILTCSSFLASSAGSSKDSSAGTLAEGSVVASAGTLADGSAVGIGLAPSPGRAPVLAAPGTDWAGTAGGEGANVGTRGKIFWS